MRPLWRTAMISDPTPVETLLSDLAEGGRRRDFVMTRVDFGRVGALARRYRKAPDRQGQSVFG
jgi:hypothetical protein